MDREAAMTKVGRDIQKARADYDETLRSAWKKVRSEQRKPDSFARQKNSAMKEIKNLPWTKACKARYLAARNAGLATACRIAQGVLYAAEGRSKGVREGGKHTAFQSARKAPDAVRYGGKYAALEASKKAVDATGVGGKAVAPEGARQALTGVENGTEYNCAAGGQASPELGGKPSAALA